jgi:hypothetical protein
MTEKQLIHEWKQLIYPSLTLEQYRQIRNKYTYNNMNQIVADELVRRAKINPIIESFPTAVKKNNPVYEKADRDSMSNRHGCMGATTK